MKYIAASGYMPCDVKTSDKLCDLLKKYAQSIVKISNSCQILLIKNYIFFMPLLTHNPTFHGTYCLNLLRGKFLKQNFLKIFYNEKIEQIHV